MRRVVIERGAPPVGLLAREHMRTLYRGAPQPGLGAPRYGRAAWRFDHGLLVPAERRIILPGRDRLIVPQQAAISVVTNATQISTTAGQTSISQSINCTGGDYLLVTGTAYDSGFAAAMPASLPQFDGTAMVELWLGPSGGGIASGAALWGIHAPTTGGANLTMTFPTNTYGPVLVYWVFSGVTQSATANDVRRTPVADNSEGSSISIALGAGQALAAGDYIVYAGFDWGDTAHTPSGVCVEDRETTWINTRCAVAGHFLATGTSHTGGWTSGSDMTGVAMALIPAGGGGGSAIGNPGLIMAL